MPHAVRTRRSCERGAPAAYVRRAVAGRGRPSHQVVAIVHASADGVRRGLGRWGHVEAVDETTCRVVMHVDDLAWPLLALGSVGAALDVAGPPALPETIAAPPARFWRSTTAARAPRRLIVGARHRRPEP